MTIRDIVLKAERTIDKLLGVYDKRLPATSYIPLKELGQKYQLEIITHAASENDEIQFDCPSSTQVRVYTNLLAAELAVYPPDFIKRSNIERLVLCTNLRSHRHKVSGITDMGLFKIDTLFLDLSHTAHNWDFSRRTFHHELFHAIDFSDSLEGYIDTEWRKLNSEDYKYFASDENFSAVETRQSGFITMYSTRSVLEDKAELYSFMIVEYPTVHERCLTDQVLSRKVEHLKKSLRTFSPHFNDTFWDKVQRRSEQTAAIKNGSPDKKKMDSLPHLIDSLTVGSEKVGAQKTGATKIDSGQATSPKGTVEIEEILGDGRKVWRATVKTTSGESETQLYYSFNKLRNEMKKFGLDNQVVKEEIMEGKKTFSIR
jgi:hypothetical protein